MPFYGKLHDSLQFKYYFDNEDVASISYREFNVEVKDQYPTFTICLLGRLNGDIFKNNSFYGLQVILLRNHITAFFLVGHIIVVNLVT